MPPAGSGRRLVSGGGVKLLILAKYGARAASTRHRLLQYIPFLEREGFECDVDSLLSDRYLARKLDEGRVDAGEVLRGAVRRLGRLAKVRQYSLVVLYKEALPYLPAFFERALSRLGVPYVCDLDDAVFHQYDRHRWRAVRALLGRKIGRVLRGAALVVAGNDYLASYARLFNPHVKIVPTVVDVDRFVPRQGSAPSREVTIGWIGSPSTATYVAERADVWRAVTKTGEARLRLVGAGRIGLPGVAHESREWREDREVADLQSFDIGIMPLRDDPWSRGKCGFKLIEYMACALPVVASPVGVNTRIVAHGENGYLCDTDDEWIARLGSLIRDAAGRRRMGHAGRERVREAWSLQRWGPELASALARVTKDVGPSAASKARYCAE